MNPATRIKAAQLCTREVAVVSASLDLSEAACAFREARRAELPVVQCSPVGLQLVGVLTTADLIAGTRSHVIESLRVEDVMSTNVVGLRDHDDEGVLLDWFDRHGLTWAPVADARGVFVGIVAFCDLVARIAYRLANPMVAAKVMVVDLSDGLPNYTD
jgi:CBS-domain-containing membrane protein